MHTTGSLSWFQRPPVSLDTKKFITESTICNARAVDRAPTARAMRSAFSGVCAGALASDRP